MKDMKLWKVILLLVGSYIGLGLIYTITIFGATGQISEIFGSSSDWLLLWINFTLGHSLASPGITILYAADIGIGGDMLLMSMFLLMLLPGIISAILVGLFAQNSKVAFRVVFCSFYFSLPSLLYSTHLISTYMP